MSKLKKPYVFLYPSEIYAVIKIIKNKRNQHNPKILAINSKGTCVEFYSAKDDILKLVKW